MPGGAKIGHIVTRETREKISKALKGRPGHNLGKRLTLEQREHLRQINLGKKQSPETVKKRFAWAKGYRPSEETKRKMRESNLGKKRTEETRIKIGNSKRGKKASVETRKKMSEARKGKRLSEEAKKKISIANKGRAPSDYARKRSAELRKGKPAWNRGPYYEKNLDGRGNIPELKKWKKDVLKRDNFTCQKTKRRGVRLAVHHIYNYADYPDLRWDVDNGITLAEDIHKEFHRLYGSRHNTKEQLLEFLTK